MVGSPAEPAGPGLEQVRPLPVPPGSTDKLRFKPLSPPRPSQAKSKVMVLAYHQVSEQPQGPFSIAPQRLQEHLTELLSRGWKPITLADFLLWNQGKKELPPRCFLLTFDDGYRSLATVVAPMLARLRIPATAFVITGHIAPHVQPWEPERISADEIRALVREGWITFASHTHDLHDAVPEGRGWKPEVYTLTPPQVAVDLDRSIRELEALTGYRPLALAWPFGTAPPWAQALARERFALVFSGTGHWVRRGQFYEIPRLVMDSKTPQQVVWLSR